MSRASKGEIVTIKQVQLGIGVRVQLYVGIGTEIPLFVTACYDNSGILGVVTLKSPGGFLPCWFSLFVNKSSCQFIFHYILSLIGDFVVLPRVRMLI